MPPLSISLSMVDSWTASGWLHNSNFESNPNEKWCHSQCKACRCSQACTTFPCSWCHFVQPMVPGENTWCLVTITSHTQTSHPPSLPCNSWADSAQLLWHSSTTTSSFLSAKLVAQDASCQNATSGTISTQHLHSHADPPRLVQDPELPASANPSQSHYPPWPVQTAHVPTVLWLQGLTSSALWALSYLKVVLFPVQAWTICPWLPGH